MNVERTFYTKRGPLKFVVLSGKETIVRRMGDGSSLHRGERKVVRAKFIGTTNGRPADIFPRSATGMAICNPVDVFSLKYGCKLAVDRATQNVRAAVRDKLRRRNMGIEKMLTINQ